MMSTEAVRSAAGYEHLDVFRLPLRTETEGQVDASKHVGARRA